MEKVEESVVSIGGIENKKQLQKNSGRRLVERDLYTYRIPAGR
jgi:hypothetical protein